MVSIKRDVIAIGDVHGDGDRLMHVLKVLKLVKETRPGEWGWSGGTVGLVIMGDVLDGKSRSDFEYKSSIGDTQLVQILHKLSIDAKWAGGYVVCLLGNHEFMNLAGIYDYVHPQDMQRNGGPTGRGKLMAKGGATHTALRYWKRWHVDNHTLFCHAGVHTSVAAGVRQPADLDAIDNVLILEHREYMSDNGTPTQVATLQKMLRNLDCKSMVIGHNSVNKIRKSWGGNVTMVDAMFSRAYGKAVWSQVLVVRPDGAQEIVTIPSSTT